MSDYELADAILEMLLHQKQKLKCVTVAHGLLVSQEQVYKCAEMIKRHRSYYIEIDID